MSSPGSIAKLNNIIARGGYQIIDLNGIICEPGGTVTVPGIYDYLREMLPLRKPAVLYNFTVSAEGVTKTEDPMFVKMSQADDTSSIIINDLATTFEISISPTDEVSI